MMQVRNALIVGLKAIHRPLPVRRRVRIVGESPNDLNPICARCAPVTICLSLKKQT